MIFFDIETQVEVAIREKLDKNQKRIKTDFCSYHPTLHNLDWDAYLQRFNNHHEQDILRIYQRFMNDDQGSCFYCNQPINLLCKGWELEQVIPTTYVPYQNILISLDTFFHEHNHDIICSSCHVDKIGSCRNRHILTCIMQGSFEITSIRQRNAVVELCSFLCQPYLTSNSDKLLRDIQLCKSSVFSLDYQKLKPYIKNENGLRSLLTSSTDSRPKRQNKKCSSVNNTQQLPLFTDNSKMKQGFTFIDLFAGCGGLTEGFYKHGFTSLTHVEKDQYACQSIRTRMKYYGYLENKISVLEKDITDEDILDCIEQELKGATVDVLIGGPPCQAYSSQGRAKDKNGMRDDPRNFLFESYEKILTHFRPKIFVFENVTGLLTAKLHKKEKIVDIILQKLGQGYNLLSNPQDMVLNSCDYGVPQLRERVILIGVRKDIPIPPKDIYNSIIKTHYNPKSSEEERKNKKKYVTVRDAIADLPALKPGEGEAMVKHHISTWNDFLESIRSKEDTQIRDHVVRTHNPTDKKRYYEMSKNEWTFQELLANKPSLQHSKPRVFNNSYVVQFWDSPARTIIAHLYKDGNQFIHPDCHQQRTLTVREAARLQSFPDDFVFEGSRTQQFKQIGNAVPPLMAEAIAKSIKIHLSTL